MRDATEVLSAAMTLQEALEKSKSSEFQAWPSSMSGRDRRHQPAKPCNGRTAMVGKQAAE